MPAEGAHAVAAAGQQGGCHAAALLAGRADHGYQRLFCDDGHVVYGEALGRPVLVAVAGR